MHHHSPATEIKINCWFADKLFCLILFKKQPSEARPYLWSHWLYLFSIFCFAEHIQNLYFYAREKISLGLNPNTPMDKFLSDKLKVLSFILIILVVYIHANNGFEPFYTSDPTANRNYIAFIKNFFSKGIALVAVPLFFLLSLFILQEYCERSPGWVWIRNKKENQVTSSFPFILIDFWLGISLLFLFGCGANENRYCRKCWYCGKCSISGSNRYPNFPLSRDVEKSPPKD